MGRRTLGGWRNTGREGSGRHILSTYLLWSVSSHAFASLESVGFWVLRKGKLRHREILVIGLWFSCWEQEEGVSFGFM